MYNCAVLTIEVIPLDAAEASLNEPHGDLGRLEMLLRKIKVIVIDDN